MEIKILVRLFTMQCGRKLVMDVLAETGVDANVEKVTDLMKIAEYGVMGTPAWSLMGRSMCRQDSPEEDVKTGLANRRDGWAIKESKRMEPLF